MIRNIHKMFESIGSNCDNSIIFFREGKRYQKKFSDFSNDIDSVLYRLDFLNQNNIIKTIAIIGPISYDWILCDLACIKGGFLSVAIPETLPENEIVKILNNLNVNLVLLDYRLKNKTESDFFANTYFIETRGAKDIRNFYNIYPPETFQKKQHDNILKEYSVVFSSGTSEKIKYIKKSFVDTETDPTVKSMFSIIKKYITYKNSFWSRSDNKLLLFMPFSHPQQRDFFRMALLKRIDIVLSDSLNYQKHIILEKPNIMVSVPIVYELMANRIQKKLQQLSSVKKIFIKLFVFFKINRLPNRNLLKLIFTTCLFYDIKKIYGGRADYFVSGSAAISTHVVNTFYNIGVKIFQGYGQTEIGNIALTSNKFFRVGSVGKPLVDIKIGEDSEILVKYDSSRHFSNKNLLTIDGNGYICTGDLGYLDSENYLFIIGRKDDTIVLETGKKVFPEKIENEIKNYEFVQDAFVFSPNGCSIYVVLICDPKMKLEENYTVSILKKRNTLLSDFERIEKFYIEDKTFSIDNGFLTSTYKKKRKSLRDYYSCKNYTNVY